MSHTECDSAGEHSDQRTEDALDIGSLFVWGQAVYGQLGVPAPSERETVPVPAFNHALQGLVLTDCQLGDHHSLFLTGDGILYACGDNSFGQCGLPVSRKVRVVTRPTRVRFDHAVRVIACGSNHCAVADSEGNVYTWGYDGVNQLGREGKTTRPGIVPLPGKCIAIACGNEHTAALCEDGTVYTWGRGTSGQLGYGSGNDYSLPRAVELPDGIKVKHVDCGAEFTMLLTVEGRVYSFGCNSDGQLGIGERADHYEPRRIKALDDYCVATVITGRRHTAAITEKGDVFVWGCNTHGQLGLGDLADRTVPVLLCGALDDVKEKKISSAATQWLKSPFAVQGIRHIACGDIHTVAVTQLGDVYSWGGDRHFQLGLGERHHYKYRKKHTPSPKLVLRGQRVKQVYAGGEHTVAFAQTSLDLPIARDLLSIYQDAKFCDLEFRVKDNEIVKAHSFIFLARCPAMLQIFANQLVESHAKFDSLGPSKLAARTAAAQDSSGASGTTGTHEGGSSPYTSGAAVVTSGRIDSPPPTPKGADRDTPLDIGSPKPLNRDSSIDGSTGNATPATADNGDDNSDGDGDDEVPSATTRTVLAVDTESPPNDDRSDDVGVTSPTAHAVARMASSLKNIDSDSDDSASFGPLGDDCISEHGDGDHLGPRWSSKAHSLSSEVSHNFSQLTMASSGQSGQVCILYLRDVSARVFSKFLEFLYSDYIADLTGDDAFELLTMMQMYDLPFIPRLHNLCQRAVCRETSPDDFVPLGPSTVVGDMEVLVNNEDISDIMFMVGTGDEAQEGGMLYAHKAVLYARAGSFCTELGIDPDADDGDGVAEIINLPTFISAHGFRHLLRYLYTGELAIPKELREEMFRISNHYTIPWLWQHCTREMRRGVTVANAPYFLHLARQLDCPPLVQYTLQLLAGQWTQLEEQGFLDLSPSDIEELHMIQFGKPMPDSDDEDEKTGGRFRKIKGFFTRMKNKVRRKSRGRAESDDAGAQPASTDSVADGERDASSPASPS